MKVFAKKQELREVTYLESHTCDFCKKKSDNESWRNSRYDIEDVDIKYRTGFSYPDAGYEEFFELDICPACFVEKLIPWAKENGAQMIKQEFDY